MLFHLALSITLALFDASQGAVTSPQPSGKCYCVSGSGVNIRSSACGAVTGSASTGQAFKSRGGVEAGCGYSWFSFNYNGGVGWSAGSYLNACADTNCGGSCALGAKLGHAVAWSICQSAGGFTIWSSSGRIGCRTSGCTSLEQVRCNTVLGIVAFRRASGCSINVTGGTEEGHASGTQSHYNGYKLDISLSSCVDSFITRSYPFSHTRSDGARVYKDAGGNLYAKEGNHWDILYT